MDRRISFPVFGNPPTEYERVFFDDQSRKLNQLMSLLRSPGEGRNTTLVLTNLPTSDYGLEAGSVYVVDNGVLRVSVLYAPYVQGVSASGSVGSVTVTTV
jgi:hypothetical protein